jgi:hypothetical protein
MKRDDIIGGGMLLGLLLALGAFFMFAPERKERAYGPVEIPGSTIAASAPTDASVEVTATFVKSGFVTIHQSIGGAPGPMIGLSEYRNAGEDQLITIATEILTLGMSYIALLHVDDSDGTFDFEKDMPVTSGGLSVRADFVR